MGTLLLYLAFFLQGFSLLANEEYLVQNYTTADGLPVNWVTGMVQDNDGYMYFATLDGLVRFDGYEFKIYNSANTEGLNSNRIRRMIKTDTDEIWMAHTGGNITRKQGRCLLATAKLPEIMKGKPKPFYKLQTERSG